MLTVIQRVSEASVVVENECIAAIDRGMLVLCGFAPKDNERTLKRMLDKCLNYRIFSDENDKMNLSLQDIAGDLLIVPQFTLMADTDSGRRPSFSTAAPPAQGKALFQALIRLTQDLYHKSAFGQFAADMKVSLCNDGPVTFVMQF